MLAVVFCFLPLYKGISNLASVLMSEKPQQVIIAIVFKLLIDH